MNTPHETTIRQMRFIGADGSLGFRKNSVYTIQIIHTITVFGEMVRIDNVEDFKMRCEYRSYDRFLENWQHLNTASETIDSIERSAYDSAMSEEVKEKSWEIEFDERFCSFNLKSHNLCSKCKPFDGSSVADGYGSADEYIKDFIRTQRSLAYEEGHAKGFKDGELYANKIMNL